MNSQNKIYIGQGKKQNDTWFKSSICLDELIKYVSDRAVQPAKNGKTYINVNINIKDQLDQYGNDVSLVIDTYREDTRNAI